MRRMRTIFVSTFVLAACFGASPARGKDPAPAAAIVRTLPLRLHAALEAAQDAPATSSADCLALPRATSDRSDFEGGRQVHVIYLVPSNAPDGQLDIDGTLECSLRAQQQWLAQQSGGLEWRFDTFLMETTLDGQAQTVAVPDITFVKSPQPAANLEDAGPVRDELAARGFDDPAKRYLTYVVSGSGGGTCGDAFYPLPHIGERWGGQYSQVYLDASPGCGSNQFGVPGKPSHSESVAQQELMHNDGMTPVGAPHSCLSGSPGFGHVCTGTTPIPSLDPERFDVMYPFAGVPLSEKKLDIGHDDYFQHPFPIEDLASSPFLRPVSERPPVPPPDAGRTVSLDADRDVVEKGAHVRFSGSVAGDECTAGVEVVLEARRPTQAGFEHAASASTASDGTFRLRLRMRRTQVFRATVASAEDCDAAASPELKVRVKRG